MRVTFRNKLKKAQHYDGMPRIEYLHDLPCDLRMFIEKLKPVTDPNQPPNPVDWKIAIEGTNQADIAKYRKEMSVEFATYIKRRTRKDAKDIHFKQLESLADMRSV